MKRLLSVLLLAAIFVTLVVPVTANSASSAITHYGFRSGPKEITQLDGADTLYGYAEIPQGVSGVLVLALYRDNTLLELRTEPFNGPRAQELYTDGIRLFQYTGNDITAKLMILDSMASMKPLVAVKEIGYYVDQSAQIHIPYNQLVNAEYDSNSGDITISYLANPDDRKATQVTLNADADFFMNGFKFYDDIVRMLVTRDYSGTVVPNFYGELILKREPNVPYYAPYTVAELTHYTTAVVDSVDTKKFRVSVKNETSSIKYDPNAPSIDAKLYDTNGNLLAWEELKENDVLSYLSYDDIKIRTITATRLDNTAITGQIRRIEEGWLSNVYTINGTSHGVSPHYDARSLALGDEGTFYLDHYGNITWADLNPLSADYGYIVDCNIVGGIAPKATLLLYTSKGEWKEVTAATKIKIDGLSGLASADMLDDMYFSNPTYNDTLLRKQGETWFIINGSGQIEGIKAIQTGQLIAYETNEAGEITMIDRAAEDIPLYDADGKFTQFFADNGKYVYQADRGYLSGDNGNLLVTDQTILMYCPASDGMPVADKKEYQLATLDNLKDGQSMTDIAAFNVNESREVELIVIYGNTDIDGVHVQPPVAASSGYGYIIDLAEVGNLQPKLQVKLFLDDGSILAPSTATEVTIDGIDDVKAVDLLDNVSISPITNAELLAQQGDTWFTMDGDSITGIKALLPGQIIHYTLDQNGQLIAIDRASSQAANGQFQEYAHSADSVTYRAATQSFTMGDKTAVVTGQTKLLICPMESGQPSTENTDYELATLHMLADGQTAADITVYNATEKGEAELIVICGQTDIKGTPVHSPQEVVQSGYGYIVGADTVGGVETRAQFKLFLQDGTFATVNAADLVTIDGISNIPSEGCLDGYSITLSPEEQQQLIQTQGKTWFNLDDQGNITGVKALDANQLIAYKSNARGEIISIDRAADDIPFSAESFTQKPVAKGSYRYNADDHTLTGQDEALHLTEDTVILVCPPYAYSEDDYLLFPRWALYSGLEFSHVSAFNVNEQGQAGIIVVENEMDLFNPFDGLAVLTAYSSAFNEDGRVIDRLTFSQNNEDRIAKNTTVDYFASDDLLIGQVALPYYNSKGEICNWDVIAQPDTSDDTTMFTLPEAKTFGESRIYYYAGRVAEVQKNDLSYVPTGEYDTYDIHDPFIPDGSDMLDLIVRNHANVYIYDETISNPANRVSSGNALSDIVVSIATARDAEDYDVEVGQVFYDYMDSDIVNVEFVAKEIDNVVTDIVFYIYK